MRFFLFLHTPAGRADEVARAVRPMPRVKAVEVITGPYDVVVHAEAPHEADLVAEVVEPLRAMPAVIRLIACVPCRHGPLRALGEEPAVA